MSTNDIADIPASPLPKRDPELMTLRAPPRAVVRLNRRMLAVGAGTLAAAVLGATLWSLQSHQKNRGPAAELYNVDRVSKADSLDQLPKDYSKVRAAKSTVPILGEPLPGDLGAAMVKAHQPAEGQSPGGRTNGVDPAQTERLAAEEASRSSVFFRSSSASKSASAASATIESTPSSSANQPFDPSSLSAATPTTDPTSLQNHQDQKEAFLTKAGDTATRNAGNLQVPSSPYQLMAGTIIPAALLTGINSDLPGQVIASVTEAVYDTATGRFLLIPQGSRLIGRYDSQVSFGQRRVLLIWTRLILPDTSSIALDKLPGIDPVGYAGLEDGVDWHWDRILSAAALSTLLGIGAELAAPENQADGNRTVVATRNGTQDTVNQVGQDLTKRNASIQPTLTIRPGLPMRVMVNKDLVLRPYQPLFFHRGSSQ